MLEAGRSCIKQCSLVGEIRIVPKKGVLLNHPYDEICHPYLFRGWCPLKELGDIEKLKEDRIVFHKKWSPYVHRVGGAWPKK